MKRLPLLLFIAFPILLSSAPPQRTEGQPLVFTNVTVIDATGSPSRPGMNVIVRAGRIAEIRRSATTRLPENAQVIDGRGKFLIPGLWDLHVHLNNEPDVFLRLFIANGVMGIRDMGLMGVPFERLQQWRSEIANGSRIGPRIIAGQMVDGPTNSDPDTITLRNAEEGRETVRAIKQRGFDFVKVLSLLPRDIYFAVADEAKKQRIPLDGHIQVSVSAAEASAASQRTVEHLFEVYLACSTREAEIRNHRENLLLRTNLTLAEQIRIAAWPPVEELREGYSPEKCRALFRRFVRNHTWQVPGLANFRNWDLLAAGRIADDPNRKYIPRAWQEEQKPENSFFQGLSPEALREFRKRTAALHIRNLELVREMRRAGVRFGAGTDTSSWNPVVPGFSLHEELELFVEAGLTPMEALQTATRNAAEILGRQNDLGTIAKGKLADLVLLDANPLENIANTRKVHAVVVNGRMLAREELDQMLAQAEAAARR